MVSNQVKWAVEMYNLYIQQEGSSDAYVRGCHYFLVSLPESSRQIPARKAGETRLYENLKKDYKRLSELLVDARIAGLLHWDLVTDQKNDELLIHVYDRHSAQFREARLESESRFDFTMEEAIDYDEMVENITLDISQSNFNNQTHRQILIIEKAKAKTTIEALCRRYGTDVIQFGGQHSVTRVHQVCQLAEKEDKPLRVFYLSDLDIAGYFMPDAFMKRVQDIYPRDDHDLIRVGVSREQVSEFNLPVAFDVNLKKYPQGQIDRFEEETGSLDCIEVDAMPREDLLRIIEDHLKEHSGLDQDKEDEENLAKECKEKLDDLDLDDFKERYEDLSKEFNDLVEEVREYQSKFDKLEVLKDSLWELESEISTHISEEFKKDESND